MNARQAQKEKISNWKGGGGNAEGYLTSEGGDPNKGGGADFSIPRKGMNRHPGSIK